MCAITLTQVKPAGDPLTSGSKAQISNVWSRFFTNIEHLPRYVFTHDLIVAANATQLR